MKRIIAVIALLFLFAGNVWATDQILATEEMVGAGHATKADTLNRALNKLTTAGDIPYATAAATVARLATVANGKIFGNAAGTAPEYATGMKIGTLTRDMTAASGDVAYTGVGFKPSIILFLSGPESAGASAGNAVGIDSAAAHFVIGQCKDAGSAVAFYFALAGYSVYLNVDSANYQRALVKTLDNDGFTLTWEKGGSPTGNGTVYYLAFR